MRDLIPRVTGLFAPVAMKVAGGVILALLCVIAFMVWRADDLSDKRDKALERVGAVQVQLEASNASIDALQADLERFVEQGRLTRQEAREASQEALEAGQAALDAAQDESRTDWRGVEGL